MSENRFEDKKFSKVIFNSLSQDKLDELREQGLIEEGEWYVTNDGFKDNAGGLDVLDISQSLYIDETQGLRRWLNGSWVDINDQTRPFLERLYKASALNPELLCTNSEYEAIVASSPFYQCGKFVIDRLNNKIRLPKVVYANGALNISNIGNLGTERILVYKKEATDADPRWCNWYSDGWLEQGGRFGATGSDVNTVVYFPKEYRDLLFDVQVNMQYAGSAAASWQYINARNVTTQKFETVCQASTYHTWRASGYGTVPTEEDFNVLTSPLQYYFIQIATGLSVNVNIENDIELNNPYSLGDSKYSTVDINNVSWLQGGSQSDRTTYPSYYDMLVRIYNGEEFNEGITVKLEGDATITRLDHVINMQEERFKLPTLNGTEDTMPDKTGNEIDYSGEVTVTATDLTAPYNGWFRIGCEYQENKSVHLYNRNTDMNRVMSAASSGDWIITDIWANKGDIVQVNYQATTNRFVRFHIATKPGKLYFYMGETVQNANLINAGKLAGLTPYCLVESWHDGTSWCRKYSDGWCEQGGQAQPASNNNIVVTLHQPFIDTNYNINAICINDSAYVYADKFMAVRTHTTSTITFAQRYLSSNNGIPFRWEAKGYWK